jgi:hypothetical protein
LKKLEKAFEKSFQPHAVHKYFQKNIYNHHHLLISHFEPFRICIQSQRAYLPLLISLCSNQGNSTHSTINAYKSSITRDVRALFASALGAGAFSSGCRSQIIL